MIASYYEQSGESDQDYLDPARFRYDNRAFPKLNDGAAGVRESRSRRRESNGARDTIAVWCRRARRILCDVLETAGNATGEREL